jgi:Ni,Fe-hydrogenase III small subunit/NAD-dependent dihydropyrimidine dehydrogenase PreA subunit
MLNILLERLRQGHRTVAFPKGMPPLSPRFRGLPVLADTPCAAGCASCAGACPTGALGADAQGLYLDLGRCILCGTCEQACPGGRITFSRDHRLAASRRDGLILRPGGPAPQVEPLEPARLALFARSLRLRQISAGGCNACEADINVLTTVVFDLGRFGIDFVASPRHADGVAVTGPVTRNMLTATVGTFAAVPDPRVAIAIGTCAISGGLFAGSPETAGGATPHLPVDLFIPGCPPHPLTILDGLLRLLGRATPPPAAV